MIAETVKLGEICEVVSGATPKSSVAKYWDGDIKWITPAELDVNTDIVIDSARHLTAEGVKAAHLRPIPPGAVILSSRAPIGKTAIAGCELYCNQGFKNLICGTRINNRFLYHYLSGKTEYLNSLGRGATFKELSKRTVESIEIKLPSLDEQIEIAARFDAIHALMLTYRHVREKLDYLVKSRFVEMFGSSVNDTPWPTERVESIAHVNVGVVIKPAQYYVDDVTKGVRAFRSLNVQPMHIKDDDWVYFSLEGNAKNRKSVLAATDVLIVRSGYPGTSCVVGTEYEGANAVDLIIAHPDLTRVDPVYLAAFNNYPIGQQQIKAGIGGAAQQHFNVGRYKGLTIPVPPIELQQEFAAFVAQVDKSQYAVRRSIKQLELLKAKLEQEYFS